MPHPPLPQGDLRLLESDIARRLLALAARRYLGESQASAYLDQINQQGTKMARIAVRPAWVGVVDFQSRMPSALGGIQP